MFFSSIYHREKGWNKTQTAHTTNSDLLAQTQINNLFSNIHQSIGRYLFSRLKVHTIPLKVLKTGTIFVLFEQNICLFF